MEKKDYLKPTMQIVQLRHQAHLLQASDKKGGADTNDYTENEYDEE